MHPPETPDNYTIVAADEATHIYDTEDDVLYLIHYWTDNDNTAVETDTGQLQVIYGVKKSTRYATVERLR